MPDTSRTYLQMTFVNAAGANYSISLPYPKSDLTTLDIETAMDLLITKNIILTAGGALASKKDGGIITRSFIDLVD